MIKQPFKKQQATLKLPQIATKTENSSSGFEPNRRALSSAKNSTTRTDELEKQLFSKLDDYDKQARKQKKAEKVESNNKVRLSAGGKRQTKRTSTAKLQKTTACQLTQQSESTHSKTQTMIESTPLHSNKQNTFMTNPKIQTVDVDRKPTQQQLELYGESKLVQDCPFTQQQMNRLYKEYEKEDCYIEYTSSKELKQMSRMLNNCQQSLNDLTKETQKMMKDIGIIMSQEKQDEIEEEDQEEK